MSLCAPLVEPSTADMEEHVKFNCWENGVGRRSAHLSITQPGGCNQSPEASNDTASHEPFISQHLHAKL